ncbi:eukaryotic initiation factor 4A-15-like protein, partial [Tanacetum coccineum]
LVDWWDKCASSCNDTFDSMGLQENLLRGIYTYGFEKPSAIQQRGIVPFTKGFGSSTCELAQHIKKVMRALGDYLGVKVHVCVGGTSVREDQRILSAGVHVVVGNHGCVFDMLRRQLLPSDYMKMFVLDVVDVA